MSLDKPANEPYYIPIGGIKVNTRGKCPKGAETMPKGVPRDHSIEHTILHRMKIARGHLDRVIDMVAKGHYCIDVIHQSIAVQAALRQTDQLILKNHMQTCVAEEIKKGNAREVIDEVMKVMEKK